MKAHFALLLLAVGVAAAQYYEPYGYADSYYDLDEYSDYASPYSIYEPEPTYRQSRGGGKGGFWYYWGPGYGQKGGGHQLGGYGGGGHGGGYGGGGYGGGYGGGGHGGGGYGGGGFGGGGFGGGGGGGGGWGWKKPKSPVKHIYHQPPKFPYTPPPIIHAAGPVIKRHHPVFVKGWQPQGWGWK